MQKLQYFSAEGSSFPAWWGEDIPPLLYIASALGAQALLLYTQGTVMVEVRPCYCPLPWGQGRTRC